MVTKEASAKIVGFLYQMERALYRIFSNEHDSAVFGIETADDVVEEILFENGHWHVAFEQDKHASGTQSQPYQDSSKNLWHTIHIWLNAMKEVREKYNKITYYLVTNKTVGSNNLATILSEAKTEEQINSALVILKEQANAINGKVKDIAVHVLSYSEEELKFLIKNIELLDNHGTHSGIPLKQATINLLHIPTELKSQEETIYQTLFGFMIDQCLSAWKVRRSVELTKGPFSNLRDAEISKIKRRNFIDQPIFDTEYKKFMDNDNTEHLFIEQLQYININTEQCNKALEHYWAFHAERVRLEDTGEIPLSAWRARDYALYERWEQIKNNIEVTGDKNNSIESSQEIYTKTLSDYKANLNGMPTEYLYFTRGNYHNLANYSENETFIHWHSNFKDHKGE
ncbi:ABC-three component system protein [Citrobacter farmeri]|uniref:ABC-three component system protein n=1 Tax=Citrobacter farmeri TaxID=67824 RepID=UPI00388D3FF7|nr:hypothetical protein [Citrobacter farmeri]